MSHRLVLLEVCVVDEKLVFTDLETGGLNQARHPVIQIAAIAVDAELRELETFEVKVLFDHAHADPDALKKNNYSETVWARLGVEPEIAAKRFAAFLRRHATIDMVSLRGKPYQLAQLVAHNANFDAPFLHAWYKRLDVFLPARYLPLCTLQRALWLFDEDKSLTPPLNYQLGTLCEYFGVPLSAEDAHDAFYDVRATVELYRAMRQRPTVKPSASGADADHLHMAIPL